MSRSERNKLSKAKQLQNTELSAILGRLDKKGARRLMERVDTSLIALRRILRATEMFGRDLAKAAGLTPAQFRVLQVISEKGWSTPKAIAQRMGVSQATMTTTGIHPLHAPHGWSKATTGRQCATTIAPPMMSRTTLAAT